MIDKIFYKMFETIDNFFDKIDNLFKKKRRPKNEKM